ncbi:MAG: hypothetical protein R3E95_08050 [Thiolinea sp.]
MRHTQKLRHSTLKKPQQQARRQQAIREAYETYLELSAGYLTRMEATSAGWGVAEVA